MNTLKFDLNELRGRITSKYGNQRNFASAIKSNPTRVSNILNGRAYLDTREIMEWSGMLDIDIDYIPYFFFRLEVY